MTIERTEFLRSMEERIKNHQDNLRLYEEVGAHGMVEKELEMIRLLHQVKTDYVLDRK
jgi:hypothetical protein